MAITANKQIFCAGCQAETAHTCSPDKNNEIVAVCTACQRALKFPMTENVADHMAAHKSNAGQITVEMAAKEQEIYDVRFKKLMGIE
ncbi:hypothetical protein EPO05_06295 [Patescibacteria group bacterium]|nr:MAG: hypothetical protein EPO05_06295 [Patescibacteria group bacterium]